MYNRKEIMTYTQYTVVGISFLKTVLSRTRPTVVSYDLGTTVINLMIFFSKSSEIGRSVLREFWNVYRCN